MSIQVKHRRDTRAVIMGVTPAVGELGYATDTHELTMGDGLTLGGTWAQKKNQTETLSVLGMSGNFDDWNPSGYSNHTGAIAMQATAACSITGILSGGIDGRRLELYNVGTFPIVLKAVGTGSLPQRRFSLSQDLQLDPNGGATLIWDLTHAMWFCVATTTSMTSLGSVLLSANNLSDVASASSSRTNLGLNTMALQAATAVAVTGGTIDGTVIGGTTRAVGSFSQLGVGTSAPVADIHLSDSTSPRLAITDTSATLNNKTFDWQVVSGVLSGRAVDDAYASAGPWVTVARSGATVGLTSFPGGGGVTIANGQLTVGGAVTMNGSNIAISLQPTGTGSVTINPATVGSINHMAIGNTNPNTGVFTALIGTSLSISGSVTGYLASVNNTSNANNAGGVIGFSGSDGTVYGISGYRDNLGNRFSFYGSGNALIGGRLDISGNFSSGVITCSGGINLNGVLSFTNISNFAMGYAGGADITTGTGVFDLMFGGTNTYRFFSNQVYPNTDNFIYLGNGSNRWFQVWAGLGTIQTSDEREKQDIRPLNQAEKAVAARLKGLLTMYRWKDQVEKEGDAAKLYAGIIAQRVEEAFTAEGLDPNDYAMWRKDELGEWHPVAGGDPVFTPNGQVRYSVDYNQILCFIVAAVAASL